MNLSSRRSFLLSSVSIAFSYSAQALPLNIVVSPWPQVTTQTCQSYGLAVLLAYSGAPGFEVRTQRELRIREIGLRGLIERSKARRPQGDNWEHWDLAVREATSRKYELTVVPTDTADATLSLCAAKTGISSASALSSILVASMVGVPVILSVSRIGDRRYREGHIVVALGTDIKSRSLVVLNSAASIGTERPSVSMCHSSEDGLDNTGDRSYTAKIDLIRDFAFQRFRVGFVKRSAG